MKKKLAIAVAALAVLTLISAAPALAEVEEYEIDPEHTSIGFKIRHFFSKVPGQFTKFSGTIMLDRSDYTKSSVEITIETASINTNEDARDRHLRSDAFFDAESHPQITFKSTKVTKSGDESLNIEGDLTIRGITKKVTLETSVLGFWEYYNRERAGFEAKIRIDRHDFKVSWNDLVEGVGILGDDVDIEINLEAKKKQ